MRSLHDPATPISFAHDPPEKRNLTVAAAALLMTTHRVYGDHNEKIAEPMGRRWISVGSIRGRGRRCSRESRGSGR